MIDAASVALLTLVTRGDVIRARAPRDVAAVRAHGPGSVGVPGVRRVHPVGRADLLPHARLDALAVLAELLPELRADGEAPLVGVRIVDLRSRRQADPTLLRRAV